jgi:hypothetical protein
MVAFGKNRRPILDCVADGKWKNTIMSLDLLKQQLGALNERDRRRVMAYLITLQDQQDAAHRAKLAEAIDRDVAGFATLEEMDRRLHLAEDPPKRTSSVGF